MPEIVTGFNPGCVGNSYNPPMSERPDPYTIHLRPRASMKQFRGAPWAPPQNSQYAPQARPKPSAWYQDYQKMQAANGPRPTSAAAVLGGKDASARYQRSDRNPGVGYDAKRKKFTLMVVENGKDVPLGSFLNESEGVEGVSALSDLALRGPHGLEGLPRTKHRDGVPRWVLMEMNGPPGVQLLPAGHWQKNMGGANKNSSNVNVGIWTTPHEELEYAPGRNRPMSASLLAGRPAAARRQRPSTALLRDKGQWNADKKAEGGIFKGAGHLQETARADLCGALEGGERVEYNPDRMKMCWSGMWNQQRPSPGIPYND